MNLVRFFESIRPSPKTNALIAVKTKRTLEVLVKRELKKVDLIKKSLKKYSIQFKKVLTRNRIPP